MKKMDKKSKVLTAVIVMAAAIGVMGGCNVKVTHETSTTEAPATQEEAQVADTMKEIVDDAAAESGEEVVEEMVGDGPIEDYPSNSFEERVGKTSFASYDEIIGLLEGDEAYALVKVKGYDGDVLLVSDFAYDDQLGHMAAVECTPYTVKSNGQVTADSLLISGGTANPVALSEDGYFYVATHMSVEKSCYGENGTDDAGIMIMSYVAADELNDNGDAVSVSGFTRTNNSVVDDDSVYLEGSETELFRELFDEYMQVEPVNFTVVSK